MRLPGWDVEVRGGEAPALFGAVTRRVASTKLGAVPRIGAIAGIGTAILWVAGLAAGALLLIPASSEAQVEGAAVYEQWCASCHGVEGDGEGSAAGYMLPRPRDFTVGVYQIRSTGTGELPTDEDLRRIIDEGMPGTAMPGWEDVLTADERNALVDYLKTFSRFFESSPEPEPLEFTSAPGASDDRIARGREVYELIDCARCHGSVGRGDGTSTPTLENDAGFPTVAADLTEGWRFNGGASVEEIYRRLRTGLDGTPMPSFSDLIDAEVISADDLWSLAHYVRSLSPEDPPPVREVVTAEWAEEGPVPTTADDPRWDEVDRFWIPMVGQIIVAPRWFNPRVDGLWVQALHDGENVAVRVSWTDPSESPDPSWEEWVTRIVETMEAPDEGSTTGPGPGDRLTVQFPEQPTEGMERPFFLQGDSRRPAYLWTWRSWQDGPVEATARGLGTEQSQAAGQQNVSTSAVYEAGQWQVLFTRALATEGEEDPDFAVGRAIPMAFQVWDGDNGEQGTQGAVSTWYFLALQQPTPMFAYVAPAVVLALVFGLGLVLVRWAKRKEGRQEGGGDTAVAPA